MAKELDALLKTIGEGLTEALRRPPASNEQRGRNMVALFDAVAREHGGSAEFVRVDGDYLHYTLTLPPPMAKIVLEGFDT